MEPLTPEGTRHLNRPRDGQNGSEFLVLSGVSGRPIIYIFLIQYYPPLYLSICIGRQIFMNMTLQDKLSNNFGYRF